MLHLYQFDSPDFCNVVTHNSDKDLGQNLTGLHPGFLNDQGAQIPLRFNKLQVEGENDYSSLQNNFIWSFFIFSKYQIKNAGDCYKIWEEAWDQDCMIAVDGIYIQRAFFYHYPFSRIDAFRNMLVLPLQLTNIDWWLVQHFVSIRCTISHFNSNIFNRLMRKYSKFTNFYL